jgi:hypothetical protein
MLCVLATGAAAQSTSPRPLQRATDDHLGLLMSRAYDRLDQAADEARAKDLALSDGQPLLAAIYAGVVGCGCGNQLNDELWQVRKQRLEEWAKRKPESTTARLALAGFPVKYAWMARGGGYANTVSPEGWELFRARLEEGRKSLLAVNGKARQDAGWYDMMLDVALSQGWPREKYDALFSEAVEKYPYYTPLYFSRMNFYSKRWYGSVEESQRVADEAVARTRGRWGEILYARLNWAMSDDMMFATGRTDWPRMKSGFEQLVKDYPDPWNIQNFAKFACVASDVKTLQTLLPKISGGPIVAAWDNNPQRYQHCTMVAAKGHPF